MEGSYAELGTALGALGLFALMAWKMFLDYQWRKIKSDAETEPKELKIRLDDLLKDQKELLQLLINLHAYIRKLYEWHDIDVHEKPGTKIWWSVETPEILRTIEQIQEDLKDLREIVEQRKRGDNARNRQR